MKVYFTFGFDHKHIPKDSMKNEMLTINNSEINSIRYLPENTTT